jgi:hypothetical protein
MKRLLYRVYTILKEHSESCQFFDEFGILIQGILGLICLSVLIFKRYLEKPRRSWTVWFFDTLKQVFGQFTQHMSNLLIAEKIGQNSGLECEWYLNNLISDCTLGVLFCYLYLILLLKILEGTKMEYRTGDYGQDEKQNGWKIGSVFCQILWWMLIVILAKITTTGILMLFYRAVEFVGKFILKPVKGDPKLKLIFVMIIFPTIFNIMQFWFTDNFIKSSKVYVEENPEEINKERDLETGKEGMKTVSTISTTANTENNKLELAGKDIEYKIIPDNDNH